MLLLLLCHARTHARTHAPRLRLLTPRSTKTRWGQSRSSWSPPQVQHSFRATTAPDSPPFPLLPPPLARGVEAAEDAVDDAAYDIPH